VLANSANAVNPAMAAVCNVFLIIVPLPGSCDIRAINSHYSPALTSAQSERFSAWK
jgi:hypothetical protein